jgi:hypothetical protein
MGFLLTYILLLSHSSIFNVYMVAFLFNTFLLWVLQHAPLQRNTTCFEQLKFSLHLHYSVIQYNVKNNIWNSKSYI